jgi:hypothetical protein
MKFRTLLSIVFSAITLSAFPAIQEPDFAYPKTVIDNAEVKLASSSDAISRVHAVLAMTRAASDIDRDNFNTILPRIDSLANATSNVVERALLLMVEADSYRDYYSGRSNYYDHISTPLLPYPANLDEWNGRQFSARIDSLASLALTLSHGQQFNIPLRDFSDIITANDCSYYYMPTLKHFIQYKATDLCSKELSSRITSQIINEARPESPTWFYYSCAVNDNYKAIYTEHDDCEAAGYALLKWCEAEGLRRKDNTEIVTALQSTLRRFPKFVQNNSLNNHLSNYLQPSTSANHSEIVYPGREFTIKLTYYNTNSTGIAVYRLPNDYNSGTVSRYGKLLYSRKVKTEALTADRDTVISITLPDEGKYMLVPITNDEQNTTRQYREVRCVNYLPITLNGVGGPYAAASDALTGMPIKGVTVSKGGKKIAQTDATGLCKLPSSAKDYVSFYNKNSANIINTANIFPYSSGQDSRLHGEIFTDRAIYHPGETVNWSAIVTSGSLRSNDKAIVSGHSCRFRFTDHFNNQTIDTTLITDKYGRISGSFAAPSNGLTGQFTLFLEDEQGRIAGKYITVSDYRLPTFAAEITDVQRGDSIIVTGRARTFTDMPVTDAAVAAEIAVGRHWTTESQFKYDTITDGGGNFSIIIPRDSLDLTESKFVTITTTITARTAETANVTYSLALGKPYALVYSGDKCFNVDNDITFPIKVVDANDVAKDTAVTCELLDNAGNIVAYAQSLRGINWRTVKAGVYSLRVVPADSLLCDADTFKDITLFSIANNDVPDAEPIFIPNTEVKSDENGLIKAMFGVPEDGTYIYSIIADGEHSEVKAAAYNRGFHTICYQISDINALTTLQLFTVKNCKTTERVIQLVRYNPKEVKLIASSFRDKLTAGSHELWQFKLVDQHNNPCNSAMIASMYNHALDKLIANTWSNRLAPNCFTSELTIRCQSNHQCHSSYSIPYKTLPYTVVNLPSFKYIGSRIYVRGRFTSRYNAVKMSAQTESASLGVADLSEAVEAKVEDAEFDEALEAMTGSDSGNTGEEMFDDKQDADQFDYRDSEVQLAFWQPSLISDADGNISLSFVVPNANATWRFNAIAWTEYAQADVFTRELLSNKPVMVQPNLPRFLRQGDTAEVQATIFNNSDTEKVINTVVEIFDIATGEVLESSSFSNTVPAMGNAVVSAAVNAPTYVNYIGYRVRSASGDFSDGEQSAIPVLTSLATVIDSETFYLNAADSERTMALPDTDKSSVTIQYTQNPIWTVAKAISGISEQNSTALEAARSLIGNWTADYINRNYPAVGEAIRQWKSAPQDSALVSKLALNGEMKLAALNDTPWLQSSLSATDAMSSLDQMLNASAVESATKKSITALTSFQNADGGWKWSNSSRLSSQWVTESILLRIAIANAMGIYTKSPEITRILSKAVTYYDGRCKLPTRNLALIHALLPDFQPTLNATTLINKEVQAILKGYASASVYDKAAYAIILKANGYNNTARQLTESIRQFAVNRPGQGLTFPSVTGISDYALILRALTDIGPVTSEIDAMRQWLLVQAQAIDFRDLGNADYLVASILGTGSAWTNVPVGESIKVDGNAIVPDRTEALSGYVCKKLTSGSTLTITPNGVTPSYGSVISIAKRPATEIKASGSSDVAINKRLVVNDKYVTQLTTGQRVTVILTVTVKRDMEYVTIIDERPAALEPVDQLPGYVWASGTSFYRESRDSSTRLFIDYLPKGTYQISYDMTANLAGTFTSGIATLQSQYAPELTAHSAGTSLTVKQK